MIRWNTFFLVFILSFCSFFTFGQSADSNVIVGKKVFAVEDILCESSKTCNSFLKVISRSSGFPISKASYTINYRINYFFKSDYLIQGDITLDSITGSTVYRGFNLSKYLFPSSVELGWVFVDRNSNTIPGGHNEFFFDDLRKVYMSLDVPSNQGVVDVIFNDIQFIYRESDFLQFDAVSRVIQNYYATSDICDTILRGIAKTSYDLQLLPMEEFIYYDYLRIYNLFLKSNHFEILNISANDPADYINDLRKVKGRLNGMRFNLDDKYKAWNKLVRKVTPEYFAQAIFQQSMYWYSLSERVEYHYHDVVYDLGNYLLDEDFFVTNLLLQDIAKYVDKNYDEPEKTIASLVADYFMEAAQVALMQENYTHSISLVNNALFFCSYADVDKEAALNVKEKAWSGLYDSFLLVARRTIAIGNFEFSEAYLNDALNIQIDSHGAIASPRQVFVYFDTLYNALYQQGVQSLQRNIPRDALYFLSEAARIDSTYLTAVHAEDVAYLIGSLEHTAYYSNIGLIESSLESGDARLARKYFDDVVLYAEQQSITGYEKYLDSLNRDIINLEYLELLSKALELYNVNQEADAVKSMTQAAFYLNNYHLSATNMYDSLVKQIIIPDLKEKMSVGRVTVWGGRLTEARSILDKIKSNINLFHVLDKETLLYVEDLDSRLHEKICTYAENEFQKNLFVVKKSVRDKDFLSGAKALSNIFLADTVDCSVDIREAEALWNEYYDVFMYEQYIDSCKTAVIYEIPDEIIRCFNRATEFYNQINIVDFEPGKVSLKALVELYHKESLSLLLAWKTLDSDPLVSLQFVKQYLNKFPEDNRSTYKMQLLLGCRLARYDLKNGYQINADKYSDGLSSLRRFKFSYNMNTKSEKNLLKKGLSNITCGD